MALRPVDGVLISLRVRGRGVLGQHCKTDALDATVSAIAEELTVELKQS